MPPRPQGDPAWTGGHDATDGEHRALLAQCNRLADLCAAGPDAQADFDRAFDELVALARRHFAAEAALLARLAPADGPDADDPGMAGAEFEELLESFVAPGHFDRLELQRFIALWWLGHVAETAPQLRTLLARDAGSR